jgi:type IV pilus assembly protein PilC
LPAARKFAIVDAGIFMHRPPEIKPHAPTQSVVEKPPSPAPLKTPSGLPPRVSVPLKARMVFWRQMATCLKGGMTLAASLHHLQGVTSHAELREAARKAQICVERGGSLAAWMKTRPQVFSRGEAALVLAGETSGDLDKIFDRIATDLENENILRRKLFTATFLNKFVVLPLLILVPGTPAIFSHAVDGFNKHGAGLSLREQQTLALREGLKGYFYDSIPRFLMVLILVAAYYALRQWLRSTQAGRKLQDEWAPRIPLTGPLWRDLAIFRYLTALGLLTNAGVPPAAALENCAGIADNCVLDEKFARAARLARENHVPLSTALQQVGVFSDTAMSLVKTGEATGSSPEMLGRAASYYDADLQQRMTTVPKTVGMIGLAVAAIGVLIVVGMAATAYYNGVYENMSKFMGVDL